jgi:hypothetical protein
MILSFYVIHFKCILAITCMRLDKRKMVRIPPSQAKFAKGSFFFSILGLRKKLGEKWDSLKLDLSNNGGFLVQGDPFTSCNTNGNEKKHLVTFFYLH